MTGGSSVSPPLLDARVVSDLAPLLAELSADAWLLFDFHDRNPVARALLGLQGTTRRSFALFPAEGMPVVLHHPVDAPSWRAWPWERRQYTGWRDLADRLRDLLEGIGVVATEISPGGAVPTLDLVPSGVVELLGQAGVRVVSSGDLVTHLHSRWSERELDLHGRAAEEVRAIAVAALARAATEASGDAPVTEAGLATWIRARLAEAGLSDQSGCIVATGPSSADPHHESDGSDLRVERDAVLLVDLWGALPGGAPADQTWMAFLGSDPPDDVLAVWRVVKDSRDRAIDLLASRLAAREPVRGWEVDRESRRVIDEAGYGDGVLHRLGHSIDRNLHGRGPNLDFTETYDDRRLLPGIGFSVEPGVYLPGRFGVRSEVNVHLGPNGPEVTPLEIQESLF